MSIKTNVNYPLLNELYEMGIITSKSSPTLSGPFKIKTEAFAGDTSGNTKQLAETPLGIFCMVTIPTDGTSSNTLTALTEDTHYTLSSDTITWITDQSGNQVLTMYAY